ncbi:MAG: glycosyltransferase family 2 protein [Deltaproteobacteria bacterium]|nr:glycosyltransferase family 2 protein [Deltaproteobacteria bacterium]MBI3390808.1 glycosyltransferase family 2 protein [Deltaproteobacteria bacterium]
MVVPVHKLIIQIPCYDEADHLAATLRDLPRSVAGVERVEVLVIDDGSTDATAEIARAEGVDYILRFPNNRGLARAFTAGIDACLRLGADVIVNTDADNQYAGSDIAQLIRPILEHRAEMVVGDRNPSALRQFSPLKRWLQYYGSFVVRTLSGTEIPDATSGFRALSRNAALRLNVISDFTYTLETIIQAGKKRLPVTHVPVTTNQPRRESQLFTSTWSYVKRSASTMLRIYALYEPLKVFSYLGGAMIAIGMALGLRFLYFFLGDGGGGHLQSLMLTVLLITIGFQIVLIGLIADLIGANRYLIEDVLLRIRRMELGERTNDIEACGTGAELQKVEGGRL